MAKDTNGGPSHSPLPSLKQTEQKMVGKKGEEREEYYSQVQSVANLRVPSCPERAATRVTTAVLATLGRAAPWRSPGEAGLGRDVCKAVAELGDDPINCCVWVGL